MGEARGLKRSLGLFSAMGILVGSVVGASVFIVPGQLASTIGPAVWLSYLVGAFLMSFCCVTFAQVGSVLPVPGASFVLSCQAVNGLWGFFYVWFYVISSIVLFPIMSYTFVQYAGAFIPGINNVWGALAVMIITGIINLRGFSVSAAIQNFMVVFFTVVILAFSFGGFANFNTANFQPMFPEGVFPVIAGAVSTYYAFAGFNAIIELSGEIKDPGKNIPRTVFGGFIIVIILYLVMAISLVGVLHPSELGIDAPAVVAASMFFPKWFLAIISLAAICAAWTTLNAVVAATSRDLYAMAQARIFPSIFLKLNSSQTPFVAVIATTILGVVSILARAGIMKYVTICSVYLMLVAIVVAVSCLRIKQKLPDKYEQATFKLKGFWYYFWPYGSIIGCIYFLGVTFMDDLFVSIMAIVLIGLAIAIYYSRQSMLKRQGINLEQSIRDSIELEMKDLAEYQL